MFSGLVQHKGKVTLRHRNQLAVQVVSKMAVKLGDSVAINGVCLTVTKQAKQSKGRTLSFDVSGETLAKTTLGGLTPQTPVNVEKALSLQDTLGGHIVQGHVDGVGQVLRVKPEGKSRVMTFKAPPEIMKYVVSKGSVTVDGVSLTAVQVTKSSFSVAVIPYTLEHTTLGGLKAGDPVNLEADIIGKYVAKYLKR